MLALPEIEQGHHGGLFVLWRIALEDLSDELLIRGIEVEGDGRVVAGRVSMLRFKEGSSLASDTLVEGSAYLKGGGGSLVVRMRYWGETYDLKGVTSQAGSGCDEPALRFLSGGF